MKISVVGTGRVGGATAFALVSRRLPHELVLVGRDREKAKGEAYDLLHASAFVRPMAIRAGGLEDTAGSQIVLVAVSGANDVMGDRLASAGANAALLRGIMPTLAEASPHAIFVVLTNPVDVCTYVALQASGLAARQVIGTGTLIDTGRFRALLSLRTGINANDIRAYILGEHGEGMFPALSVATAGGMHLDEAESTIVALFDEARRGGHLVMRHKGYTNYAVALAATLICEAIAHNTHTILPVSTLVDGFRDVRDVCLSLPCVITRRGVDRILPIDLDDRESDQLRQCANVIRSVIHQVSPER